MQSIGLQKGNGRYAFVDKEGVQRNKKFPDYHCHYFPSDYNFVMFYDTYYDKLAYIADFINYYFDFKTYYNRATEENYE